MRVHYVIAVILLLTACGAQGAPTIQPAATATATASTIPAGVVPAATTMTVPAITVAPLMLTAAQATAVTAVPALSEYTAENGDRVLGRPSAPITMLDYSDFQ